MIGRPEPLAVVDYDQSKSRLAAGNRADLSFDLKLVAIDSSIISPPAAPTNLLATAQSASQIKLTWNDNADDNTNYLVERSTDGTKFSPLPLIGDVTTFTDS